MVPVILPILAIIAGLALLYAARDTNFLGIRDIAMSIFEEIKNVIMSAWQFITDTWNGFLDAIGISNSDFRSGVATVISVTWEAIKLGLSLAFTIITGLFKATWSFLKEYIGGTLTGIRDIILGAINFIV